MNFKVNLLQFNSLELPLLEGPKVEPIQMADDEDETPTKDNSQVLHAYICTYIHVKRQQSGIYFSAYIILCTYMTRNFSPLQ